MSRQAFPGVIILGVFVAALGWLIVKPDEGLPIGAFPAAPTAVIAPELPDDTLESLQATIAGLLQRLEILEAGKSIVSPPPGPPTAFGVNQPAFQTQVIYLGSGSTTQREWTESGAQAWLNSAGYPAGVQATFEAGLSIIGGEAWARLKNKTTGAVISLSEVFHNTGTVTWKSSPAFKLHPGNNLYVVEIKSSSNELANLAGSRLTLSQ